jgi:hypothetical protein
MVGFDLVEGVFEGDESETEPPPVAGVLLQGDTVFKPWDMGYFPASPSALCLWC